MSEKKRKKNNNENNKKKKKKKKKEEPSKIVATFNDASTFKLIITSINDLAKDIPIRCDEEGIHITSMDSAHVCVIKLTVKGSSLESYRIDKPMTFALNTSILKKILNGVDKNYSLSLEYTDGSDEIDICITNKTDKNDEKTYSIKEIDLDVDDLEAPTMEYSHVYSMTSIEFKSMCSNQGSMGESTEMCSIDDVLHIKVVGDDASVLSRPKAVRIINDKPVETRELSKLNKSDVNKYFNTHRNECISCASKYLAYFSKACGVSEWCRISMLVNNDGPVQIYFPLKNDLGHITYYLAPKLRDDDYDDDN